MLILLRIVNLALIDNIEVEFGSGLNVLSGETGTGKSTILEALDLLLGGRARSDAIRSGAEKAEVQAILDVSKAPAARAWLAENSLESEDPDELILRRVLTREGRARVD